MARILNPLQVREGKEFTGLMTEFAFGSMYQVQPQYMSKVSTALFERNNYMTVYSYIKQHFPTVYLESDDEWRWMLHGNAEKNVPLIKCSLSSGGTAVAATDFVGANGTEFYLTFPEPYFSGNAQIVGEMNEMYPILVIGQPMPIGGYSEYRCRLNSSDNNKFIPYEEVQAGKRFSEEFGPAERSLSRNGTTAKFNSSYEMRNVFTKIRKEQAYAGNMLDKVMPFAWESEGKTFKSFVPYASYEMLRQWEADKARMFMYSTYNGDNNGNFNVLGSGGHVIQMGAGIREQAKYGNYQTYNVFDIEAFSEILLDLSTDKLGMANRKFVIATGEWGMFDFSKSLENYTTLYTPARDTSRIYTTSGNGMGYKGQFLEFKGPNGVEITLIHDALKDDKVRNKRMDPSGKGTLESRTMDILNLSTSDGKSNIQCVEVKNAGKGGDIRGFIQGMRSPFTQEGAMKPMASSIDGWEEHYMFDGGAQITDSTRCLVYEKSVI